MNKHLHGLGGYACKSMCLEEQDSLKNQTVCPQREIDARLLLV